MSRTYALTESKDDALSSPNACRAMTTLELAKSQGEDGLEYRLDRAERNKWVIKAYKGDAFIGYVCDV